MLFRVAKSALLLLPIRFAPIQFPAETSGGIGGIQEDEYIRVGQPLPHILNVGVFLGDVAGAVAQVV